MRTPLLHLVVIALLSSACGDDAPVERAGPGSTTTTPFACPVTIPPVPGHVPSSDHAPTPAHIPDAVWYGDDDLWTVLAADGSHLPRKSVWWSVHFDVHEDETPEIGVTYRQLDGDAVHEHPAPGTNANTAADGWFMMNGIDPDEPGCWEVTATYLDATLTYVYESS